MKRQTSILRTAACAVALLGVLAVGPSGCGGHGLSLCDDVFKAGARGPRGDEIRCRPIKGAVGVIEIVRFRCTDGRVLAISRFGWWIDDGKIRSGQPPLTGPAGGCTVAKALGSNQS